MARGIDGLDNPQSGWVSKETALKIWVAARLRRNRSSNPDKCPQDGGFTYQRPRLKAEGAGQHDAQQK
jgi:hypothetical protein